MSIEVLRRRIEQGQIQLNWANWPLTSELRKWIALREGRREILREIARWPADRPYKIDPLADKISTAFADFLYGEEPEFKPAKQEDAEVFDPLIEDNDMTAELHRAVQLFSSEGEVWWRIYTDPSQSDRPLVEWHSRTMVYPLWRGRRATAVAFVSETMRDDEAVWRYVQYHEEGRVVNVLYRNSRPSRTAQEEDDDIMPVWDTFEIGEVVSLEDLPETAELEEEWDHGLPMLAGRLINKVPKTRKIGRSDYDGVEDLLFDLNEAHTIDAENFRLAGKKRAVMDERYRNQAGDASGGEEIIWADSDGGDDEMEEGKQVFKILEYSYEGSASIKRKEDLERTILTRVGIARQFVDANTQEGFAPSGTALRVRLIPTTLAATGKAREFDENVPKVLNLLARVDALPANKGGFARTWADIDNLPSVKRSSILPMDDAENAQKHQTLITAELESIEQAVEDLHPDWEPERRMLEVKRILANRNGYALDDEGNLVSVQGAPSGDGGEQ